MTSLENEKLAYEARQMKKQDLFADTLTRGGMVYVKRLTNRKHSRCTWRYGNIEILFIYTYINTSRLLCYMNQIMNQVMNQDVRVQI